MSRIVISKRLVLINSASMAGKTLLSLTLLVWVQRHLLRNVPVEEYEVLALVYPLLLYVPLITLVVGSGLARFIIEAYAQGDERKVTQIVSTMFPLTLTAGLLVFVVGSLLAWNIDHVLDIAPAYVGDARMMFWLLVVPPSLRTILMPFMVGMQVKQKFLLLNVMGFCLEILRVALLFTLLFGVSTNVRWVVVAAIPSALIDITVVFVMSRRLVPALRFRPSEIRRALIRPITTFGGSALIARATAVLREMSGPFLLNRLSTPVQVTSYRMGSYVETRFFPAVLGPLLTVQPALTAMHATGSDERLRKAYFRITRYLLWAFLIFAIPGMVFHRELWDLYLGPEVVAAKCPDAGIVLLLLFSKTMFIFAQPVLAQIALAKARAGAMAWRVVVVEGLTVTFTWYLLAHRGMGATGVALSTLVLSSLGAPIFYWPFGLRLTGGKASEFLRRTVLRGMLPALCAAPVWIGLWLYQPPRTWLEFLGSCAAGWLVYVVVLLVFLLEPHEREDLRNLLSRLRPRAADRSTPPDIESGAG